jgi:hypothetical protein
MKNWLKAYWAYFRLTLIVSVAAIAPPLAAATFDSLWYLLLWFILIPLATVVCSKI